MGQSKFFTNDLTDSLFDKFRGIVSEMSSLHSFHAVVAYFRSSGYFKIRKEFAGSERFPKVQILVGINIDNIFRKHNRNMLFLTTPEVSVEVREQYGRDFVRDVRDAGYYEDVEQGILALGEDLRSGQVELKIHPTRDLHAKFYLFLPQKHTPNSDGWVIMGSSNLSESGLGLTEPPRYELNVAMKDYDDVAFCKAEFDRLWNEGVPITCDDIEEFRKKTHLGYAPTPYELYMKLLIDYFGEQVEDDFTLDVPEGFKQLKYQDDAVRDGYQKLLRNNGFFLADVVGLGKTVVAAMIAKRFIEENGLRESRVLVVCPPALMDNWQETFRKFRIGRYADFVSCGSLDKILEGKDNYRTEEEYDLILVDEAHRFRGDTSEMYDALQRICKSERINGGRVGGTRKMVVLISATPLNNRPDDLYSQLLLFQDKRNCTIDGVPNLQDLFARWIATYKRLIGTADRTLDVQAVDELYDEIRRKVIDKVTVRRTRNNILNHEEYKKDLDAQGIVFPEIERPREVEYKLPPQLKSLFEYTMYTLTGGLKYARYRAIENLQGDLKKRYPGAEQTSRSLASIYRTHMVKRLESSFFALRKSLRNLRQATQGMIDMFEADKIIILPELKVKELQALDIDLEDIIAKGIENFGIRRDDFVYRSDDFVSAFIDDLHADVALLDELIDRWERVEIDPKLDRFIELLHSELFDKGLNPTGKLVVFSESKDTIGYLLDELKSRLGRGDILAVSAAERKKLFDTVQANFDANYKAKKDEYNIIISTDVLAEGVNLHRANIIVNYDTPWNASRLMQRIGRVNRIGSVAGKIVNYMFYPSDEGDAQIRLYKNALAKLQGFHSAFGEDSQIYSKEEIVNQFELFNSNISDDVDELLLLKRQVQELHSNNPELYGKIKELPYKSRTGRSVAESGKKLRANTSLAYVSSPFKQEFYLIEDRKVTDLGFLEAVRYFRAEPDEPAYPLPDCHYVQVVAALNKFDRDVTAMLDDDCKSPSGQDKTTGLILRMLGELKRGATTAEYKHCCEILARYVEHGTYQRLNRDLARLVRRRRKAGEDIDFEAEIRRYVDKYHRKKPVSVKDMADITPHVVISETFV